jgi:hypothetical protein
MARIAKTIWLWHGLRPTVSPNVYRVIRASRILGFWFAELARGATAGVANGVVRVVGGYKRVCRS